MRIYIIHSPSTSENYIDNVLSLEQKLIENGEIIMNPLPDQPDNIGNKELYEMYGDKIKDSEKVIAMKDWCHSSTGNPEMAEAMKYSINIEFVR